MSYELALIEVVDFAASCGSFGSNSTDHKGANVLTFVLSAKPGSADGITTGTYTVVESTPDPADDPGHLAMVSFGTTGSDCSLPSDDGSNVGVSGTVHLDTVSATGLQGTFDVQVAVSPESGHSEHLTGRFDSTTCASLLAEQAPTCS
ncbi:MAG: hypothetical protein ABI321_00245 [Polyangia bacterium]